MSGTSIYVAPVYEPPQSAVIAGALLRAPRNIRHTGNFSYVFSTDREEQLEYVDGIMAVASTFCILWVIWAFTLLVLKFKGKQVGCASGRAFVTVRSDDEDDNEDDFCNNNDEKPMGTTEKDDLSTTSESSGMISLSDKPLFSESHPQRRNKKSRRRRQSKFADELEATSTDPVDESSSDISSQSSSWISTSYNDNRHGDELRSLEKEERVDSKINPRENRSRFCFVFFASIALLCVPLILVFSYGPMRDATDGSDQLILSIRDTMDQVEASLNSIESASRSADEILSTTPTDAAIICPLISAENYVAELGVDLTDIIQSVENEYDRVRAEISNQLTTGNNLVDWVEAGVSNLELSVAATERYMWIVPVLLFSISVLSAISILGVIMAWKEKSGSGFQRTMSWMVLPLLILASIATWMVVVFAAMGSMVGTDLCLSSSRVGSPDQTIQEIFSLHNASAFQLVSPYTNQCQGPDPTKLIDLLEQEVQTHIDNIWRQMSQIDSLGRSQVIAKCGDGEAFSDMLDGARNLAKLLTAIRRSLSSTERALQCNKINPIYTEAAHVIICTSALKSTVNGWILFLVVSICVMAMISLRASWLRHIEEEKVYHDEDEVAENMILDEHEEYLAYISKYKHEWQEYGGFDKDGEAYHDEDSYYDDDDVDSYNNDVFEESSDVSGLDNGSVNFGADPPTESYGYDTAVDGLRYASDNVYFQSLSTPKSEDDPQRVLPKELLASPSLLLPPPPPPPPMNPQHRSVIAPAGVIPLHHAATAPAGSTQLYSGTSARSDIQRRAFYGTSARNASKHTFGSTKLNRPAKKADQNFDTDTNETEDSMGFEVQMRL